MAGLGFGELFFISLLPLSLYWIRPVELAYVYGRLKPYFGFAAAFITFFVLGNLVGMHLWEIGTKDVFILLRQSFYLFVLVPLISCTAMRMGPRPFLNSMLAGVICACLYNIAKFDFSVFGSMVGQNSIGEMTSALYPYVLFLTLHEEGKLKRVFSFLVLCMLVLVAFFSLSKGAWVSISISTAIFYILLIKGRRWKPLFASAVFGIVVLAGIFLAFQDTVFRFFFTELSSAEGSGSNEERILSALSGLLIGLIHPVGVGSSHYPEAAATLDIGLLWIQPDPHNAYAHALSWAGILGFLCVAVLLLYPTLLLFKHAGRAGNLVTAYLPMLAGLYLFANTSGGLMTQPFFWAFSGVIFGHILGREGLEGRRSEGIMGREGGGPETRPLDREMRRAIC
jgi:O-antigen ligase